VVIAINTTNKMGISSMKTKTDVGIYLACFIIVLLFYHKNLLDSTYNGIVMKRRAVTPCSSERAQCFGGIYYFRFQGG
jgi:hypothetical protein